MNIKDNVAIVTGGASGLRQATVQKLIAQGASVAIFDRNKEAGLALSEELGDKVKFIAVDVANEESVINGINEVMATFGGQHY
jgi:3-hydroxyacyl-CoA dehydrogenase / 3-hydroxy-2-methylbutyryl-CoA dehydrogenase